MKLKYLEYQGKEEKEKAITSPLNEMGPEGIRLYFTQKAVRKMKDVHNCTTLHEYFLRKTNDRDGVIVIDEACMHSDLILGALLMTMDPDKNVLFIQDKYEIRNMGNLIRSIKESKNNMVEYLPNKGGVIV
jgi:hypothetical protein